MTTFESKVTINKPVSEVYNFLADFNNHQELMPDNIADWKSTYNEAEFNIKNMAHLSLKIAGRVENTSINIVATEKPPFEASLTWSLVSEGNSTIAIFTIVAELNMMMKMIASGPLQKLAGHQTSQLSAILS